jgi:prevent-host-death family protein
MIRKSNIWRQSSRSSLKLIYSGINRVNTMKHFNLSDARARFAELLEEVERGETLVISRDGEPTADAPSPEDERRAEARKAIEGIKEARKTAPRVTVEEILQWRDEGRRF